MTVRRVPVYFEFGSFRGRGGIFLEVLMRKKKCTLGLSTAAKSLIGLL